MAEQEVSFRIDLPEGIEPGHYANLMSIWHSPYDFVLDFAVTDRGEMQKNGSVEVPSRVVARIRIPLSMAQDVLRALADSVSKFEEAYGPIRKLGDDLPMYPPKDI